MTTRERKRRSKGSSNKKHSSRKAAGATGTTSASSNNTVPKRKGLALADGNVEDYDAHNSVSNNNATSRKYFDNDNDIESEAPGAVYVGGMNSARSTFEGGHDDDNNNNHASSMPISATAGALVLKWHCWD